MGGTKSHILDLIKDYCVENNLIDQVEEKPTVEIAETAEVLKFKLEFEREEWRLACEAACMLRLVELKEARKLRELELKAEADREAAACEHELKMAGMR